MARKQPASGYAVGYARPPAANQFKPGQSGNAGGRRRRSNSISSEIEKELNTMVTITEGNQTRRFSKRQVIVKRLVNLAAKGDPKCLALLLRRDQLLQSQDASADPTLTPAEKQVFEALLAGLDTADEG